MKKINYVGLNLDVFYEKIDNGLEIFVIPMNKFKSTFATFTSKYGSAHNNFKLEGEEEYKEVPHGIAHFLEHKMFEMKDKIDPFTFYSQSGSYCNANTWDYRTVYLFECLNNFNENLDYLLDYVQDCYLTEENVQKEKGIITEEAKMYYDYPSERLDMMSSDILFHKDYMKYPVIGTFESINDITKEQLEACYKTFYHPSNMFLVVAGPVSPQEVIDIVKNNQSKKNYDIQPKILFKNEIEPNEVFLKYKESEMKIEVPRIEINYKISLDKYSEYERKLVLTYFSLYGSLKLGKTSDFSYDMVNSYKILNDFSISTSIAKNHIILKVYFSSNDYLEVIDKVKEEIKKKEVLEEDFQIRKNRIISSYIAQTDSVTNLVYNIIESYVTHNQLPFDDFAKIQNLSFEEMNDVINKEDFINVAVAVLKPKIN